MFIIKNIIEDIRSAIKHKCWYSALALAITIPDICSYLEKHTKISSDRYISWFDKYVSHCYSSKDRNGNKIQHLSGNDCYALRCAYLHQGDDNIIEQGKRKYLEGFKFTTADGVHCNKFNNILQLEVNKFCETMCLGAETWAQKHSGVLNEISILKIENTFSINGITIRIGNGE